jgi:hypothetical protein
VVLNPFQSRDRPIDTDRVVGNAVESSGADLYYSQSVVPLLNVSTFSFVASGLLLTTINKGFTVMRHAQR